MKSARTHLSVLLLLLALLGAAGVIYATALGPGSSNDSVTYVGAARSLLQGHGYQALAYDGTLAPMTHYPPLYPTLLALPGLLGVDPLVGARWLAALCMAANILLVGVAVYRFSHGALWAAAIAAVLTLASAAMTVVHAWAWAEPPFLILALLTWMLLDRYSVGKGRAGLWLAGVCMALACLTRYTGLALVAAAMLWVLWGGPGTLKRRVADALLLAALGGAPLGLWFARNLLVSSGLANRQIVYHPITREQLAEGLATLAGWLWPEQGAQAWAGWALIALFVGVAVVGAVRLGRQSREREPDAALGRGAALGSLLPGLFVLVYAATLVVSISLFDAHTPLDDRILVPVFVGGLVCIWSTLGALLERAHWGSRAAAALLGLALVVMAGQRNVAYVQRLHSNGAGYAATLWTQSALMRAVEALPPDTALISNVPDGIYILTGRPAAWLPYEVHAGTRQPNAAFGDEIAAVAAEYAARDGRLVYFHAGTWRWYLPKLDTLKQMTLLETVVDARDGEMLRFADGR